MAFPVEEVPSAVAEQEEAFKIIDKIYFRSFLMSQDFNFKGYEDYFKELEKDLDKYPKDPVVSKERKIEYNHTARKRKKGIFKVMKIRKSAVLAVLLVVVAVVLLVKAPWSSSQADAESEADRKTAQAADNSQKVEQSQNIAYKLTDKTVKIPADNDAKCAIIIDKSDNTIVAERNIHTRAYPASTTKIMTLIVAVEKAENLESTFVMTQEIADRVFTSEASAAGFKVGETVTVKDLMYATILPSGADGALGLAEVLAGSEEAFVEMMNQKVKELGLENTNFTNVVGLHSKDNYSSVYDMAIMLDYALKNPLCKEILSQYQFTTTKTKEHPDGILLSSTLFSNMYGTEPETATILGGKTGFVNESGYCIASFGKANETENEYIVVTFSNSGRWPAFYGQIDLYKEFAK